MEEPSRKEGSSQDGQRAGKCSSGCRPLWADLGSALNGTLEDCVLTALIPLIHLTQNVLDFGTSITLFKMPGTSEVNQM